MKIIETDRDSGAEAVVPLPPMETEGAHEIVDALNRLCSGPRRRFAYSARADNYVCSACPSP